MVQEVTTISWGKRIINALWGVIFGIVLIFGAIYLVFWNEGHGLHTSQSLEQADRVLISIPTTPVDSQNDMHVVYLSGLAATNDILQDKLFNVSEKAIQLNRDVEMYQWQQDTETNTASQTGGSEQETKTYTYKQVWSSDLIDSSDFKDQSGHQNPADMPLKSKMQYADKVTVGDFNLPADLVKQISGDTGVDLSTADMAALKARFHKPVQQDGDTLYMGDNSETPQTGDMRVTMTKVEPQTVSIIAQQAGATLQPFMPAAGQAVSLLEMGQVSPQQMIHHAVEENQIMTWVLRLVSLIMMILGFALMMNPIVILADFFPFLGSIVGFGTGLIAFICGIGLWAVSVAIAWFAVRPVFAIGVLVVAAIVCYLLYSRKKSRLNKGKA